MNEKELSITLGLSREILKEIRAEFKRDVHWTRVESKKPEHLWEVRWTDVGISELKNKVGMNDSSEIKPEETTKEGTVNGKFKNQKMLSVLIDGKQANVLCRDSSKFGLGMHVKVRWDGVRWCVARHPRFVGKY